jgi:hypothetical protein
VGEFDEAVNRRLVEEQRAARQAAQNEAAQVAAAAAASRARYRAADELARRLRELADYLQRRTRPITFENKPYQKKWYKSARTPRGFVIEQRDDSSFNRGEYIAGTGRIVGGLLLTPDGRLCSWGYGQVKYIDVRESFNSDSEHELRISNFFFSLMRIPVPFAPM